VSPASLSGGRVDVDYQGSWWAREGIQDANEGRTMIKIFDLACGM
jgi:hypothetical protein